ncbi:MAG: hypothetical protein ACRDL2_11845 [Gaiellaceae bacterium]
MSADQLGELVRDAVLTKRPVAEIALERGFATREMLEMLLGQPGLSPGEAEPAPPLDVPAPAPAAGPSLADLPSVTLPAPPAPPPLEAAVPAPDPILAAPPVPDIPLAPPPVPMEPATVPLPASLLLSEPLAPAQPAAVQMPAPPPAPAEASATFAILVRLQTGERVAVESAGTFESAADVARSLAGRFARAGEWPLFGGRCIRPEAVVSIDIERTLDD